MGQGYREWPGPKGSFFEGVAKGPPPEIDLSPVGYPHILLVAAGMGDVFPRPNRAIEPRNSFGVFQETRKEGILMRSLATLIVLAILISIANADSWRLPEREQISSPNGAFVLDLVPSNIRSQIDYFEEESKGRRTDRNPCWARLLRKLPGGKEEIVWTADLDNKVSPVDIVVADSGRVVVGFDNWHEVGYGPNVMAVYGDRGKLRFRHSLEELMSAEQIRKLTPSTSSRHWRRGCWVDESRHEIVLATAPGPLVVVDLESGAVRSGGNEEIRNALSTVTGDELQLPLELAEETKLQDLADFKRIFQETKQPVAVRLRAAVTLEQNGDGSGERLIVQQASSSQNPRNRAYALEHVTRFCGLRAVPLLQRAMRSEDSEVWNAGKQGMVSLGGRAVPILVKMLHSKETANFRGGAAHVLGEIRRTEASSVLLDSLGDRD